MESMATYYLQMILSYLGITLQCFVYLAVGILAFRVAGPILRALKAYTATHTVQPEAAPGPMELPAAAPAVGAEAESTTAAE